MEYLSLGLNLVIGGFLPVLGTLWTNLSAPVERQVDFGAAGTWSFFAIFVTTGILGIVLIGIARQFSKRSR